MMSKTDERTDLTLKKSFNCRIRNPKFLFPATTSTVSGGTTTAAGITTCYYTTATLVACKRKKRRMVLSDMIEGFDDEDAKHEIQPDNAR